MIKVEHASMKNKLKTRSRTILNFSLFKYPRHRSVVSLSRCFMNYQNFLLVRKIVLKLINTRFKCYFIILVRFFKIIFIRFSLLYEKKCIWHSIGSLFQDLRKILNLNVKAM